MARRRPDTAGWSCNAFSVASIKALALGARFVFVGRPFAYAAAVGGEAGVAHAIALLASEVSRDMAMLGVNTLDELDARRHLWRASAESRP